MTKFPCGLKVNIKIWQHYHPLSSYNNGLQNRNLESAAIFGIHTTSYSLGCVSMWTLASTRTDSTFEHATEPLNLMFLLQDSTDAAEEEEFQHFILDSYFKQKPGKGKMKRLYLYHYPGPQLFQFHLLHEHILKL